MRKLLLITTLFLQQLFFITTTSASCLYNPLSKDSSTKKHTGIVFKLNPDSNHIFNEQDAKILRDFIEYRAKIVGCDAINLKVYTNSKDNLFVPVNIVDELKQKGYIVVHLDCSNENIVFQLDKNNISENITQSTVSSPNLVSKPPIDACNECGAVMVKKELLEQFKDVDYGTDPVFNFTSSFIGDGGISNNNQVITVNIDALKNSISTTINGNNDTQMTQP